MKLSKSIIAIASVLLIKPYDVNSQQGKCKLEKTSEKVFQYEFENILVSGMNNLVPVGTKDGTIIFMYEDKNKNILFYMLNESEYTFNLIFTSLKLNGKFYDITSNGSYIFYNQIHFSNMDDYGYGSLTLLSENKTFILDSIYNADKKIHSSFSTDGKFLIVNTLNTLSDFYNPEQDDRIMVYSLDSLKESKVNKEYIPCLHCADGYLVGNDFFFTKSNQRDDFSGGFAWKDIYKAPWGKIQDSVKIAAFTEILAISPDGKYILGTRHFDLPNSPCAIIDVEKKKYQLLLGRDYSKADAFYSFKEKKFAFDFDGRIVYVDFPKEFPFDALRKDNPDIPNWSDTEFYKQYNHEPFK
jgi:hypothetical protein